MNKTQLSPWFPRICFFASLCPNNTKKISQTLPLNERTRLPPSLPPWDPPDATHPDNLFILRTTQHNTRRFCVSALCFHDDDASVSLLVQSIHGCGSLCDHMLCHFCPIFSISGAVIISIVVRGSLHLGGAGLRDDERDRRLKGGNTNAQGI